MISFIVKYVFHKQAYFQNLFSLIKARKDLICDYHEAMGW